MLGSVGTFEIRFSFSSSIVSGSSVTHSPPALNKCFIFVFTRRFFSFRCDDVMDPVPIYFYSFTKVPFINRYIFFLNQTSCFDIENHVLFISNKNINVDYVFLSSMFIHES